MRYSMHGPECTLAGAHALRPAVEALHYAELL
jgi:hypothetical protein